MAKIAQLQRSVFKWVQAADEQEKQEGNGKIKQHGVITAQEVAKYYGVPDDTLRNYIRREIEEEASCKSLPFTLLMFMSYTCVVLWHDPVVPINDVEDSLAFDVEGNANFAFSADPMGHKAIHDINSATDFWSWMIQGFTPLIFAQEPGFAEGRDDSDPEVAALSDGIPRDKWGMWLTYNRIVGGVRVRQERSTPQGCATLSILQQFYKLPCLGDKEGSGYELYPEKTLARYTVDPQREFWMWTNSNITSMLEDLVKKEKEEWFDRGTKKIEISIPVFNGQLGVYSIIYVDFFVARGGHIWKRILPMSTYSQWWHSWWNVVPDALWIMGLLSIMTTELTNVMTTVLAKTGGGLRGLYHEYLSFWNLVDWTTVGMGGLVISGYVFRFRATNALNIEIMKLGQLDQDIETEEYRAQAVRFLEMLATEVDYAGNFRLILGAYPALMVMRLFEAFAHQPRLSIVTTTLGDAFVDLTHFLLVFLSIFLTYAIAGIVLFGREVDGFTNFTRALNTCFRIMMGDFDWEELLQVGRMFAGVWFLTFVVIIVLLMLNMLLAIVMDAYSEQKARLGEAETLWEEFLQVFGRWRGERSGELRSLKEVSRAVRIIKDGEMAVKLTTHTNNPHMDNSRTSEMSYLDPDSPATPKSLMTSMTTSFSFVQNHFPHEDFCLVTVDSLLDACPQMQEEQAMELIQSAVNDYYLRSRGDTSLEEMCHIIRKVNYSTKRLKRHMLTSLQAMAVEQGVDLPSNLVQKAADSSGRGGDSASGSGSADDQENPDASFALGNSRDSTGVVAMGSMLEGLTNVGLTNSHNGDHSHSVMLKTLTNSMEHSRESWGHWDPGDRASWAMANLIDSGSAAKMRDHMRASMAGSGDEELHYAGMLHNCRAELKVVREWIGEEELRDVDPDFARHPMEFVPLSNLDDAVEFSVKRVLESEMAVVRACRTCGISPENDEMRSQALGKVARVLAKDPRDNTVKCRVQNVGDMWFGIAALSQLRPKAVPVEDPKEKRRRSEDGSQGSLSGISISSETDGKARAEEALKKIYELEIERRIGQQTVTEAINAVSELKWQQVKEKTDKSKLHQKILGLRKKLVSRAREHRRLGQEAARQEERLGVLTQSRDEYMDLVTNLESEKKKLQERMKVLGVPANQPLALEDKDMTREEARSRERDAALEAMRVSTYDSGDRNGRGGREPRNESRRRGGSAGSSRGGSDDGRQGRERSRDRRR